ncbi:MAG: HEAT repeat domain-containing protein [Gammaproteobacteria bacterium]|nr:HEAT repeat domain-containing protein [Gammaproteobacteria bacterium]
MKSHGVFSLSQVENGAGLPYLEKLIRKSKNMEIQKQALFWLTESDEERALPILESILGN